MEPDEPSLELELVAGPPIDTPERRWRAGADDGLTIGRGQDAGIRLPDASVSRRHARIARERGVWTLHDLGSRHGTVLNARALQPGSSVALTHRDLLQVGPWNFRVSIRGVRHGPELTTSMTDATPGRLRRVLPADLGSLAQRRLDLLLDGAERLSEAEDEAAIARAVVDTVVRGAASARAALVRCHGGFDTLASAGEGGVFEMSRSLIEEASRGGFVRLDMGHGSGSFGQSIIDLGIHSAFCAPVRVGERVVAVLYLDARGDEAVGLQDSAAFVGAMARMCGLALANLSRAALERDRTILEADLAAARVAQRMMMPAPSGRIGPVRFAVTSHPGRFVAGDLIGIEPRAGGRVCCYLGDVAGKGAGAAMLMGISQSYLAAALHRDATLEDAVNGLNAMISPRIEQGQFISLWIGEFDPAEGVLRAIDAGHGHAMLRRGDGRIEPRPGGGGFPIGVDAKERYRTENTPFGPDDALLLYSDGLVEQPGPAGRFGSERVRELFRAEPDPDQLVARLERAVFEFACADRLDDDLSMAAFRLGGGI